MSTRCCQRVQTRGRPVNCAYLLNVTHWRTDELSFLDGMLLPWRHIAERKGLLKHWWWHSFWACDLAYIGCTATERVNDAPTFQLLRRQQTLVPSPLLRVHDTAAPCPQNTDAAIGQMCNIARPCVVYASCGNYRVTCVVKERCM